MAFINKVRRTVSQAIAGTLEADAAASKQQKHKAGGGAGGRTAAGGRGGAHGRGPGRVSGPSAVVAGSLVAGRHMRTPRPALYKPSSVEASGFAASS